MVPMMREPERTVHESPRGQAGAGRFRRALGWSVGPVLLLWLLHLWQWRAGEVWIQWGVLPRQPEGLPGILTAPLVHDSWPHLLSNSVPLLGLGLLAVFAYPRASRVAVPFIWIVSGLAVWLLARDSYHIGASGLTHGLLVFTAAMGFLRREPIAIAFALIALFLFGSMFAGVVPAEPGVSWEYHLAGGIAGLVAGLLTSRLDPRPPRPPPLEDGDPESLFDRRPDEPE
jgi:membrane associated rhomboid family serine protease